MIFKQGQPFYMQAIGPPQEGKVPMMRVSGIMSATIMSPGQQYSWPENTVLTLVQYTDRKSTSFTRIIRAECPAMRVCNRLLPYV